MQEGIAARARPDTARITAHPYCSASVVDTGALFVASVAIRYYRCAPVDP